MIGKTLSHYEILELLGKGGMGEVYRARDTRLGREVALKVLPIDFAQDRDRVARFEREARAVSSLKHRNIVHLYDVGREGELAFYTMELVDGVTLQERLKGGALSEDEWVHIAEQLAGAIGAAHMQGVVHRDLKPANILLQPDGEVKVLDFGLAKVLHSDDDRGDAPTELHTQAHAILGTAAYMSPEQAMGRPAERTSDIFSLGIILYEMAAGRHPFAAGSSTETMARILSEAPPMPSTEAGEVDPNMAAILEKCLEKDPSQRYQSAGELQAELKRLHSSELTGSRRSAAPAESRRGKWIPALGGLLIIAAAAIFFSTQMNSSRGNAIASIAVLPFENGTGDPETTYLCDGLAESLIHSLSELPELRVIARRSSFRFRESERDLKSIGEQLDVDALVVGRLVTRGDEIAVSAEMVDVRDLSQVWGERYELDEAGLVGLESRMGRVLASSLRPEFAASSPSAGGMASTDDETYRLYLRGREYLVGSRREMSKCIELLDAAVERDPNYALAHATLAKAHILQARHGTEGQAEAARAARTATKRALELGPRLAEAHAAAGTIAWTLDWDWDGAEREFTQAIDLNPNSLDARLEYCDFLVATARLDEAIAEGHRAKRIDPLSSSAAHWLAIALLADGQYEEALTEFQNAIELNPTWTWGFVKLAKTYAHAGRFEEAMETVSIAEQMFAGNASPLAQSWMAQSYVLAGANEKAQKVLSELQRQYAEHGLDGVVLLELYAVMRDREQALHWGEVAYRERSTDMGYLSVVPNLFWPELADEPRFQALMQKMNLPFRPKAEGI